MELNTTTKNKTITRNPEGARVLARRPEIQLFLEASNLNIKQDEFYKTAPAKLKSCLALAKTVDKRYLLGLSRFLTDNGLKLSPVVLLSSLSSQGYSFRENMICKTFNTPQRIAEAIALNNMNLVKLNNSFKKHILKNSLSHMSNYTITKNQMTTRKIKTRDLIKLLRPVPINDYQSLVYKSIIEGNMTLSPENTTLTRVKSNKDLTNEQKLQYYKDNIDTIAINELIRNLKFIDEHADFETDTQLKLSIMKRFKSINDYRFLNIFDLIEVMLQVPSFEKCLFEVVKDFCDKTKEKFNFNQEGTVLYDFSGSMEWSHDEKNKSAFYKGFKYLVLLSLIFKKLKIRAFTTQLLNADLSDISEGIKQGKVKEAYQALHNLFSKNIGGTAILRSTQQLLRIEQDINNLILITDEVSWAEGEDLRGDISQVAEECKDKNVIVINPAIYKGTVFKSNLVAMASLTSSVIYNIFLLTSQDSFVNYIKNYE